jgi:hypothetical protein
MTEVERSHHVDGRREQLCRRQRDAIWKWRWLGFRDSTPGFKGAMIMLGFAAVYIALRTLSGP